jgi:quercetin dioxygenase-like cupin family protein
MHDAPLGLPWSPAPGVTLARRSFFGSVAAACAAAHLPGAANSWRTRADGDWTVEQFVREVTPVCKELVGDIGAKGQDRYLHTLAAFAVRLGPVAVPDNAKEVGPGHRIGSNHGPEPFTMLHWILAPGAVIRPHAHTYGNVVTLGLTGEALVSNYEQVGKLDWELTGDVEVVRVQEQVLRPGDVNLVSLERHYVHGFVAGPSGASGIDITTRIVPRKKSPTLEIGEAKDQDRRTFVARWKVGD